MNCKHKWELISENHETNVGRYEFFRIIHALCLECREERIIKREIWDENELDIDWVKFIEQ